MRRSPRKRTRDYPSTERARERRRKQRANRKPLPPDTEPVLVPAKDGWERNIAGLKPYPKGVSGNPAGRKPGVTLTECYRRILGEQFPGTDHTWAEEIAQRMANLALKRVAVAAEIEDRVTGKPKVYVENKSSDQPAPTLLVKFVDAVDVAVKAEIPPAPSPLPYELEHDLLEGEHDETDG